VLTSCFLFLQRERPHPSTAENDTSVDRPDLKHDTGRKRIEKEKGRKTDRDRRDQEKDGEYDRKDLDGEQPKRKTFPKKLEAETHQGAASNAASSYNDNDAHKGECLAMLNRIKLSIRADICAVWHDQSLVVLLVSVSFRIYPGLLFRFAYSVDPQISIVLHSLSSLIYGFIYIIQKQVCTLKSSISARK
jgi:hypothetical protein